MAFPDEKRRPALILLIFCIAGCSIEVGTLNSDRIARKFGNYGIELIENKNNTRVTSLYSMETAGAVCRTFAVVGLTDRVDASFAAEHALISEGGSIGAVFRRHGWHIQKRHLYIGEIAIDSQSARVVRLMRIEPPTSAALHIYLFAISKNGATFNYATIAEVHHPEYLTLSDLRLIYGRRYSGDDDREAVRPVIDLVRNKFRGAAP